MANNALINQGLKARERFRKVFPDADSNWYDKHAGTYSSEVVVTLSQDKDSYINAEMRAWIEADRILTELTKDSK